MNSFLVVGLGNPGSRYANTRHNVGTDFILEAQKNYSFELKEKKTLKSLLAETVIQNKKVIFAIPTIFMNHSGVALKLLKNKFNTNIKNIIVIHDDLDLKSGVIRLKAGGGHGGHNGLKSIFENLETQDFKRIRIGIDHPGDKKEVNKYVIQKGKKEEKIDRMQCIDKGLSIIKFIIQEDWNTALNKLNN